MACCKSAAAAFFFLRLPPVDRTGEAGRVVLDYAVAGVRREPGLGVLHAPHFFPGRRIGHVL
jgi:hypothetical protein